MKIIDTFGDIYIPGRLPRKTLHKTLCLFSSYTGRPKQAISYWVSHKKKFIFLVNPLVASQMTRDGLIAYSNYENIDLTKKRRCVGQNLDDSIKEYYKFSFVRNPWERVVSCFHKKIVNADTTKKLLLLSRRPQIKLDFIFEEFVEYLCSEYGQDKYADEHWISQHKLLCNKNDNLYDRIGKLEEFPESLSKILGAASINFPKNIEVGTSESMKIKKEHKDFRNYYSDRLWEMICKRYATDIEWFGYKHMV